MLLAERLLSASSKLVTRTFISEKSRTNSAEVYIFRQGIIHVAYPVSSHELHW